MPRFDSFDAICVYLTTVFLILKLTGIITWSWWWVVSPLWGPWALLAVTGMAVYFWNAFWALLEPRR